MGTPMYRWWGYIRNVIRAYPALKIEHDYLLHQSVTASASGIPGGGGPSRGTEDVALRTLPRTQQKEYDAVSRAIEATRLMPNGETRLKIIELVFWKNSKKLQDAGECVGYAYKTARKIQATFIKLTAFEMGFDLEEKDQLILRKLLKSENRGPKCQ